MASIFASHLEPESPVVNPYARLLLKVERCLFVVLFAGSLVFVVFICVHMANSLMEGEEDRTPPTNTTDSMQ